jgi:hypothetical protein
MFLVRRKPDHIARADFLDRTSLTLRPTKTRHNDQRLTEWMRMPGGASTPLERHACATHTCRFRFEQRINEHGPGEPIRWPFFGILRAFSFDLHLSLNTQPFFEGSSGRNMKDVVHIAVGGGDCLRRTAAVLTRA